MGFGPSYSRAMLAGPSSVMMGVPGGYYPPSSAQQQVAAQPASTQMQAPPNSAFPGWMGSGVTLPMPAPPGYQQQAAPLGMGGLALAMPSTAVPGRSRNVAAARVVSAATMTQRMTRRRSAAADADAAGPSSAAGTAAAPAAAFSPRVLRRRASADGGPGDSGSAGRGSPSPPSPTHTRPTKIARTARRAVSRDSSQNGQISGTVLRTTTVKSQPWHAGAGLPAAAGPSSPGSNSGSLSDQGAGPTVTLTRPGSLRIKFPRRPASAAAVPSSAAAGAQPQPGAGAGAGAGAGVGVGAGAGAGPHIANFQYTWNVPGSNPAPTSAPATGAHGSGPASQPYPIWSPAPFVAAPTAAPAPAAAPGWAPTTAPTGTAGAVVGLGAGLGPGLNSRRGPRSAAGRLSAAAGGGGDAAGGSGAAAAAPAVDLTRPSPGGADAVVDLCDSSQGDETEDVKPDVGRRRQRTHSPSPMIDLTDDADEEEDVQVLDIPSAGAAGGINTALRRDADRRAIERRHAEEKRKLQREIEVRHSQTNAHGCNICAKLPFATLSWDSPLHPLVQSEQLLLKVSAYKTVA